MVSRSASSAAGRESVPHDMLTAAIKHLRRVSGDRLHESEVPGAWVRLRRVLRDSCVDPLWQQADGESDPHKRILRVALADYVEQYVRLLANSPRVSESARTIDLVGERLRITSAILTLTKELEDDYFGRLG